jgi:hypothetical protein
MLCTRLIHLPLFEIHNPYLLRLSRRTRARRCREMASRTP